MRDEPRVSPGRREAEALRALTRLLALSTTDRRAAIDEAATLLADVLAADKVDVFLYEAARDTLAAAGTSATPMGARQQALGLDRLPLSTGGLTAHVFRTGQLYTTGHADMDPLELRAIVADLGVLSEVLVPLECPAGRRGVFSATSASPDHFDAADIELAVAAAGWVGLLLDRADLTARLTAEAERRGRVAVVEELARLTRREQEVASAVAEGLTNNEISRRLTLEEGTVANHLARIIRKLGLTSRTQLAVWAVERGLYRSDWSAERDGAG